MSFFNPLDSSWHLHDNGHCSPRSHMPMTGVSCCSAGLLQVAADNAGPAVLLSFVVAAFVAGHAALCYAELVSMIPVAGTSKPHLLPFIRLC